MASVYIYTHVIPSLLCSAGDHLLPNGATNHHQACDAVCVLCHNDAQPLNFVQTPNGNSTSTCTYMYMYLICIHVRIIIVLKFVYKYALYNGYQVYTYMYIFMHCICSAHSVDLRNLQNALRNLGIPRMRGNL